MLATYINNEFCFVDTAVGTWFVGDEKECSSAVDWRQFTTSGGDSNVRVRTMGQVGSKWKWVPVEKTSVVVHFVNNLYGERGRTKTV